MWAQIPTFVRDPDGTVRVNPLKDYAVPFDLTTDQPNEVVILGASQQNLGIPMTARHDGPIEIYAIKALVTDSAGAVVIAHNVRVSIEHPGKRKIFMNRPIHLRTIQGDAGRPYVLPETIWIPAVQSLLITFHNDDVAERRVRFVMYGIKYYPHAAPDDMRSEIYAYTERRERTYTYFQTTDEPVTLAGLATNIEAFFTVPDDADLEIFKATALSTGGFTIQPFDGQTDRAYASGKIHSSLFFGGSDTDALVGGVAAQGIFPSRWPTSLLVRRSVKNKLVLDNLTGIANTIFMTFAGRKVSYT